MADKRGVPVFTFSNNGIVTKTEYPSDTVYGSYMKVDFYHLTVNGGSTINIDVALNNMSYGYSYTITPVDLSSETFTYNDGGISGALTNVETPAIFECSKYCILFGFIDKRAGMSFTVNNTYTSYGGYLASRVKDCIPDSGIYYATYCMPQIYIFKVEGPTVISIHNELSGSMGYRAICV